MIPVIDQPELQKRTLRLYGELLCRRESWAGELVFAAFPGASSSGVAAAASLVGAVSLVVDSDAAMTKVHFRDGAFDFAVNTLDEALRAIKNEVRQGRPISIGLMAEPEVVLAEAAERGLAASFVLGAAEQVAAVGAVVVEVGKASVELERWLDERGWTAGEGVSADDGFRGTWWRGLPSHQRSVRSGSRWAWVNCSP